MSRTPTTGGLLNVWDDGDDPLAGTKGVSKASGGTGLNANFEQLDSTILAEHNINGTHKTDKIDGPNLKTTVADASTIQLTGSPLKLNVKDDGITGAKIAAAFADGTTLETSAPTGAKTIRVKDGGISAAKLASQIGSYVLFGEMRAAAGAAGSTAALDTTWLETSLSNVRKIVGYFVKRSVTKYVKLTAILNSNSGSVRAYARVEVDGGTYNGESSIQSATPQQITVDVDVSGLANDLIYVVAVYMRVNVAGTATMETPVLMVTNN